jgi:hypothetical protein
MMAQQFVVDGLHQCSTDRGSDQGGNQGGTGAYRCCLLSTLLDQALPN